MCPDSWVVSWNFCSRLQLAAKSSRLVGRWLQMIYETTTKLCLRLWVHKCERGSWTKSANVINDEPAIVSQVWKCQACTLVLNHQCWPVTQMSIIHHWRHWPAVELLHSSLTESVSLPNAVHLRLDTVISTDSCNTTQTHQCIQQLSVYSLTILSNENDDNDNDKMTSPSLSCIQPTGGPVSELSGKPTATLGTDVWWLLAQSCGTAFKLVLGKWTSAANSLSSC